MKKTVLLGLVFTVITIAAYYVNAAEEPTYMERIQANTAVITEATELIKKDKDDFEAHYARGGAHFQLGQIYIVMYSPSYTADQNKVIKGEFEAAVTDFTAVVKINPDFFQAFVMRGMAYGQMGLSAAAIADFTHVIETDPKNGYAYYARGREYWATGDYLRAKEDYDRAVELDPQWKDNFYR
jgi:tetratricopeptide (TPR) repeat protein